jgi:hypothetical protein
MAARKKSAARGKGRDKSTGAKGEMQFAVNLKQSGLTSKEVGGIRNRITKALVKGAASRAKRVLREPYVQITYVEKTFGRKIK